MSSTSERPSPRSRGTLIRRKEEPPEASKHGYVKATSPSTWSGLRALYTALRSAARESHANRNALAMLVALNLYTIGVALYQHWPWQDVIFVYWLQNIVIGVFALWKLLFWNNIGFGDKGNPSLSPRAERIIKVIIFVVGFFGVHVAMLKGFADFFDTDLHAAFTKVQFTFGLFVVNHAVSFILNYGHDSTVPTTYDEVFSATFIRIMPLHLWPFAFGVVFVPTYIVLMIAYFAGVNEQILSHVSSMLPGVAVVFFMVIKTVFEIPAHLVVHSPEKLIGAVVGARERR
jgi:hypothetical protein